ncbi:lipid A biosynthesis lauroyl acyltransferase [Nisaea nitritireducens]|uniref:lipid A biosynthesis lauroyl acyltransferase n=1 Tax=Nisaea nitritireducens TaxID=568392 RepID=UPI0018685651|nr:lipid A biosynthesis lauroyl acyltransferase [Nisaea nitritireducens]
MTNHPLKTLRFRLEAVLLAVLLFVVRLLPLTAASWIGGKVLQIVGPFLPAHRTARRNLERAFPEKDSAEIKRILNGMWNNLGRTAAEYPHHDTIKAEALERLEVHGGERLENIAANPRPAVFFSAHLANWEVLPIASALRGLPVNPVFRSPNNPYLKDLFEARKPHPEVQLVAKGPRAARELIKILKQNRSVALLIDQKLREGIPVKFFGRDAMTPSAFAEFAQMLDCDIYPTRVERLPGARFRATIYPPLEKPDTTDRKEAVRSLTQTATSMIEDWVRERPSEWFWVHRRWPD